MIYGPVFSRIYNREWAFWAEHLWPFLSARVGETCPGARKWLDLCCGGGHLLKRICKAGYVGVGLDFSPYQLAFARRNAPAAKLVCGDVRAFEFRTPFDVVTCTFDSLNYLTERDDLAALIKRVARHLVGGGLFVFDMNVFEGLQDAWNRRSTIECDDEHVTIETSFDPETAIGRAIISGFAAEGDASPIFREEHIERAYRASEIEEMLTAEGFAFEKLDGHSLEAPEERSARLLYTALRESGAT